MASELKAIEAKFECPSCGNVITSQQALMVSGGKFNFKGPEKCGCGRKGSFRLMNYIEIRATLYNQNRYECIVFDKEFTEQVVKLIAELQNEKSERLRREAKK